MSLKSGHRIIPVTGEESKKQNKDFEGNRVGTIRLEPDGWFFTSPFIEYADRIYDFKFKPSDIVVMTYPKCGTTWTQEIVWTLINNLNLDNPRAKLGVNVRCPFLDLDFLLENYGLPAIEPGNPMYEMFNKFHPDRNPNEGIFLQLAETAEDPRIIKVHLPFSLLNPKLLDTCKVVYVARNPKDVCVSYAHHSRLMKAHKFVSSMDSFVNHFINDTLVYSPYWTHMKEAWTRRNHPNLQIFFYEEMKANPRNEISRIAKFLGVSPTGKQIEDVIQYTSFEAMKKRDTLMFDNTSEHAHEIYDLDVLEKDGGFFRKGVTGDWEKKLSEEQIKKIDEWTKSYAQEFDGNFKYTQL